MLHFRPAQVVCVASSLGLLALGAWGCGGRAALDMPDEGGDGPGVAGAGGAASDNSGGRAGGRSAPPLGEPSDVGDVPLPECELGFARPGPRDCTYIFDERCYSTALAACACACRGLLDSNCIISGFLDPDAPQPVSCRER